MASTNFMRFARVIEPSPGFTGWLAGEPHMTFAYMTGETLEAANPHLRSQTITGRRPVREHLKVGDAVQGGVNFELAFGQTDFAFEMALFERFTPIAAAVNITADQVVTDVNAGTQTLTAEGDWLPGMLIKTTGLAAGNNKVFRAGAGTTTDTIVAPPGTFAVSETAPAAGASAVCVGIEGAAGELGVAADGIVSNGLDFTAYGIRPNTAIKISGTGDAALDQFCSVADATRPVTAGKLPLTDLPAGWAASDGYYDALRIWIGDIAEDQDRVLTETFEKTNERTDPRVYERFVGLAANSLSLNFALNAVVTGSIASLGFYGGVHDAALGATYADPAEGLGLMMKGGGFGLKTGIARLTEGGAATSCADAAQSLNLTYANNLTPVGDLTKDAACDYNEGDAEFTVEGVYRFRDKRILDKFYAGTPSSNFIVVAREPHGYAIRLHRGIYTQASATAPARNQEMTVGARLEGFADRDQKLITITRFRHWE